MYAGNLGIAQGLEHAIEAAGLLGEGFRLVLLGGGPQRERLASSPSGSPAGSVEFRDPVQPEEAAAQMRAADALLVSLAAQPELAKFVPSKLFDCCAVGRPVVLAAVGEAPRLPREAGAALIVAPGDAPSSPGRCAGSGMTRASASASPTRAVGSRPAPARADGRAGSRICWPRSRAV